MKLSQDLDVMSKNKAKKNIHGLTRTIPESIKTGVRQACGFGCVICGNAIYQYDHTDPEFHNATQHTVAGISLLCGTHHDQKTRGFLAPSVVINARKNPFCIKNGSAGTFKFHAGSQISLKIASLTYTNTKNVLRIHGQDLITIKEDPAGGPPLLSAKFFNKHSQSIGEIVDNEWIGSQNSFDIKTVGGRIKIVDRDKNTILCLRLVSATEVEIEDIDLSFEGTRVFLSPYGLVIVNSVGGHFILSREVELEIDSEGKGIDIHPNSIDFGVTEKIGVQSPVGILRGQSFGIHGPGVSVIRKVSVADSPAIPVRYVRRYVHFGTASLAPSALEIGGITIGPVPPPNSNN